jgi:hypothetical protein
MGPFEHASHHIRNGYGYARRSIEAAALPSPWSSHIRGRTCQARAFRRAARPGYEIEAVMFRIVGQIERLTEPALKGLSFEANGRAEDDPLWSGIAAAAERRREILRRYRTGKGVWYVVIEGVRSERGSNTGEIFTIDSERCDSLKAAEAAARRLLVS